MPTNCLEISLKPLRGITRSLQVHHLFLSLIPTGAAWKAGPQHPGVISAVAVAKKPQSIFPQGIK